MELTDYQDKTVMHIASGVIGKVEACHNAAVNPFVTPDGKPMMVDVVQVGEHHFIFKPEAFIIMSREQVQLVKACRALIDQTVVGMLHVAQRLVEPAGARKASPTTIRIIKHVLTQAVNCILIPEESDDASHPG